MIITLRNPATGEQVAVDDQANPYPADWEVVSTGLPLADLKETMWDLVKAIRSSRLQAATTTFGTAQTDLESMVKINGLVSMAMLAKQAGAAFAETFTMADNNEVAMNADEVIGFGLQVGGHVAVVHARGRALRAAIEAAGSAADIEAIDVTAGWP